MFCGNCGHKNEDGVKFCASCGAAMTAQQEEVGATVVFGGEIEEKETVVLAQEPAVAQEEIAAEEAAEESAAVAVAQEDAPAAAQEEIPYESAPAMGEEVPAPKKKKKAGKILLIVLAVLIVLGALAAAAIFLLPQLMGTPVRCVYITDDGEVMYLDKFNGKGEAVEIADDESCDAYITRDGKYIYYEEYENDNVYVIKASDVKKKDAELEKILSDALFIAETVNGEVILMKDNGEVRVYSGEEYYKLTKDCTYGYYNESENYLYYTICEDGLTSLYRILVEEDAEEEELLKDAYEIHGRYDSETLVYSEQEADGTYTIYTAKRGEKGKKILEGLREEPASISVDGETVTVYYYEFEDVNFCLYDFVDDVYAVADSNVRKPSSSDYLTYEYSYYWGYYQTTDWDAYYDAYDRWEEKCYRDELREDLKNYEYTRTYRTLHCYENGKDTVIASDVGELTWGDYESVLFYFKDLRVTEKFCDVEDIWYAEEVWNYLDFTGDVMYYNINGVESEFEDAAEFTVFGPDQYDYFGGDVGVYTFGENEVLLLDRTTSTLWSYRIDGGKLTEGEKVTDEVNGASLGTYEDKQALFFYENTEESDRYYTQGDLVCYVDGDIVEVAEEAKSVQIFDDMMVKTFDYDREDYAYVLSIIADDDETEIAEDVSDYEVLENGHIMYISDDDLYYWNGKESVRVAKGVEGFVVNTEIDGSYYSCW